MSIGKIATSSGPLYVWVVIALGVTAISTFILSLYGLRALEGARPGSPAISISGDPRR